MNFEDAASSADGSSLPPVPGVPYPYPYPTLWPDPAPLHRPRRRWGRVIALVATGLTLACAAAGGLAVVLVPPVLEQFAGAGGDTPGTAPSPRPGDPVSVGQAWAKERIDAALAVQRKALLDGDESGYLSVVDPTATIALDGLRTQFRSLRAMQVAAWTDREYRPSPADDEWTVRVTSTPCFVVATCAEARPVRVRQGDDVLQQDLRGTPAVHGREETDRLRSRAGKAGSPPRRTGVDQPRRVSEHVCYFLMVTAEAPTHPRKRGTAIAGRRCHDSCSPG